MFTIKCDFLHKVVSYYYNPISFILFLFNFKQI